MLRKHAKERREVWPKGMRAYSMRCVRGRDRKKARMKHIDPTTVLKPILHPLSFYHVLALILSLHGSFPVPPLTTYLPPTYMYPIATFQTGGNIAKNHPFELGLDHVRKRGREIKIDDPFFLPPSALRSVEHPFHAAEWLYLSPLTPKGDWQHAAAHSPSIR